MKRTLSIASAALGLALALACGSEESEAPGAAAPGAAAPEAGDPGAEGRAPRAGRPKASKGATKRIEGWIEGWDETDVVPITNSSGTTVVWCQDPSVCSGPLSAHGHDPTYVFSVDFRKLGADERANLPETHEGVAGIVVSMVADPGAGGGN